VGLGVRRAVVRFESVGDDILIVHKPNEYDRNRDVKMNSALSTLAVQEQDFYMLCGGMVDASLYSSRTISEDRRFLWTWELPA
jgi:hypothetical protein